jgi:transposase
MVSRKRGNRKLICSGCGRKFTEAHDYYQREVRDLPWRKYQTTVIVELYRVCCPECGVKIEKIPQLLGKRRSAKTLRMLWGWRAKAHRFARWPGSSDWWPARCARSTCGI